MLAPCDANGRADTGPYLGQKRVVVILLDHDSLNALDETVDPVFAEMNSASYH